MPFLELPWLQPIDETGDCTIWRLRDPIAFQSEITKKLYVVPAGFQTDLASVPRTFFHFVGRANAAAVLHDFLYQHGVWLKMIKDQEEADAVFLEAMLCTKVPDKAAYAMYSAVRSFGWVYFKGATKQASFCQEYDTT